MSWFNNPHKVALREAEELRFALNKNLTYSRDILAPKDHEALKQLVADLGKAIAAKDMTAVEKHKKDSIKLSSRLFPSSPWDGLRENVEVFVIAVVIALGVRSFFLQPFKIPTGSMQPTLNGVQIIRTETPPPSLPKRLVDMVIRGRTYGSLDTGAGGEILNLHGGTITPWFEFTDLIVGGQSIRIWANPQAVQRDLGLVLHSVLEPNQTIHFRIDTGDQVLVNKVAYNFRRPHRGEVFVFKTTGIDLIETPRHLAGQEGSQFYIKRCVGVPGDELSVDPPYLKVNGSVIHEPLAFDRVYSRQNGYRGYGILEGQSYLKTPAETYTVNSGNYWAMGDNSYQSYDSRFWGPVVESNLVGTGFIVYWPFASHWGWIR